MVGEDETLTTIIEIPPYLTLWDLEKVLNKVMRQLVNSKNICIVDMKKVKNVYSATVQLLLRINDKANRLDCPIYIVNAQEDVFHALSSAGISQKIPVFN